MMKLTLLRTGGWVLGVPHTCGHQGNYAVKTAKEAVELGARRQHQKCSSCAALERKEAWDSKEAVERAIAYMERSL